MDSHHTKQPGWIGPRASVTGALGRKGKLVEMINRLSCIVGLTCGAILPLKLSVQAATGAAAEVATTLTEEQRVAMKALDGDIARLDVLLEKIHDAQLKAIAKGFIDRFKDIRDRLRTTFDQTKYDELKFETVAEFQRINLWLAAPRTIPIEARPTQAQQILFELEPSPANPAEVKAALEALDDQIKRLEDQASGRDAELARLKQIKDSRMALGRNFTKAGWDAIIVEFKAMRKKGTG